MVKEMKRGKYIRTQKHRDKMSLLLQSRQVSEESKLKESITMKKKYKNGWKPRWKGGKVLVKGYICIYSPTHPSCIGKKNKYVREHRIIIEKHLGRFLKSTEIVHHINEIKDDNRIENLMLYSSPGKHFIENHVQRDKKGRFK